MKMTKRIFAMVMAVMLIVALVPFTVSAADAQATSFKIKCDKADFKFDVYQIATVDTETGFYTAAEKVTDEGVVAALNDNSTQSILEACDKAEVAKLGDPLMTYTSGTEATVNGKQGIFYIKNTEKPSTVKKVSNSIVVTPQYKGNAWVDLTEAVDISGKVDAGVVTVSKEIVGGINKLYTTAAKGDEVTFKLTASVVGSAAEKLTAYTIKDTHVEGLAFQGVSKVEVVGGDEEVKDYETTDYEVVNRTATGFDVTLKAAALNNNDFYSKANVVVTYTAKLTDEAVIGKNGNKNHVALSWTNSAGSDSKDGNDVFVYTFKLQIVKLEQGTTDKFLENVKFAVYATEDDAKAGTKPIAENLTTNANGETSLSRLNKGTYYVKETKTIDGYNLNTAISKVEITPVFDTNGKLTDTETMKDGMVSVTVYNTKTKLPQTGMEGTMMFTFVGAGLILIAGALFVVVMKKKSAK